MELRWNTLSRYTDYNVRVAGCKLPKRIPRPLGNTSLGEMFCRVGRGYCGNSRALGCFVCRICNDFDGTQVMYPVLRGACPAAPGEYRYARIVKQVGCSDGFTNPFNKPYRDGSTGKVRTCGCWTTVVVGGWPSGTEGTVDDSCATPMPTNAAKRIPRKAARIMPSTQPF